MAGRTAGLAQRMIPWLAGALVAQGGEGVGAWTLESTCGAGFCGSGSGVSCSMPCVEVNSWIDVMPRGKAPEARAFHASAGLPPIGNLTNTFVVQGGARSSGGWANLRLSTLGDGFLFDATLGSWHRVGFLDPETRGPLLRAGHRMVDLPCPRQSYPGSTCLYTYGGYSTDDTLPCAASVTFHDRLVIFGPINASTKIGDWNEFRIEAPSGTPPGPRYGYNAARLNGTFVISGGFSGNSNADSNPPQLVYQYVPAEHRWVTYTPVHSATSIGSTGFSATIAIDSFPDITAGSGGAAVANRTMLIVGGLRVEAAYAAGTGDNTATPRTLVLQLSDDGTWNAVDLANSTTQAATSSLLGSWSVNHTAVSNATAVAGGVLEMSSDGSEIYLLGGSAAPSLYTAPHVDAYCTEDQGDESKGLVRILWNGASAAQQTCYAPTGMAQAADAQVRMIVQRTGMSLHQSGGATYTFGGSRPLLSGRATNTLYVRGTGAPGGCAEDWTQVNNNIHGMFDSAAGQVLSQITTGGCRPIACRDYSHSETLCRTNGVVNCRWKNLQQGQGGLANFSCQPASVNNPATAPGLGNGNGGVCGSVNLTLGSHDTIMWQSCSDFMSAGACESSRGQAQDNSWTVPLCKWDDEQLAVVQFGGVASNANPDTFLQWLYMIGDSTWTQLRTTAGYPTPPARAHAASAVVPAQRVSWACGGTKASNAVVLFGGEKWNTTGPGVTHLSDTWIGCVVRHPILGVHEMRWVEVTARTPWPLPRSGAALYFDSSNSSVWLFGGKVSNGGAGPLGDSLVTTADMWRLELSTGVWSQKQPLSAPSQWPSQRAFFGSAVVGNNTCFSNGVVETPGEYALVYGGLVSSTGRGNPSTLSGTLYSGVNYTSKTDMWVFRFANQSWTRCQQGQLPKSKMPPSNYGGAGRVLPVSGTLGQVFSDSSSAAQTVFVLYGGMIAGEVNASETARVDYGFNATWAERSNPTNSIDIDNGPIPFQLDRTTIYFFNLKTLKWTNLDVRGLGAVNSRFGYSGTVIPSAAIPQGQELYLFGGYETQFFQQIPNTRAVMFGCPEGFEILEDTRICQVCPTGTYSTANLTNPFASAQCRTCPPGLTTSGEGSTQEGDCALCKSGACNHNGDCTILPGFTGIECACDPCYRGANCESNICAIVIPVVLVLAMIAAFIFVAYKFGFKKIKIRGKELHENLVVAEADARQMRLQRDQLVALWNIDYRDVTIVSEPIAVGAQGEVYKGWYNERVVAVKQIAKSRRDYIKEIGLAAVEDLQADMEREYEALLVMRHKNIVEFIGTGLFRDQTRFILLEYMAGGSLQELLASAQPLSWQERLGCCRDAARGMAYIHGPPHNRVHRDLKSANLLVSERGTVKVADFGQIGDELKKTAEETGTLLWMAPEVHQRRGATFKSDVFSFGVIMFEVYTRQVPWSNLAERELARLPDLVIEGSRPDYPTDNAHLERDKRFIDLMERCWAGNQDVRPSFAEIVPALAAIERCDLAPKPKRFTTFHG